MKDKIYQQAPFTFTKNSEGFAPKQEQLDEGTNPFDYKNYDNPFKKEKKDYEKHDSKKLSTGTVYTRKSDYVPPEPEVKKEVKYNEDGTVKRGRGRPAGKYGNYKKKIQEALERYGQDQLDELSKQTLGNYIKKSSDHGRGHSFNAGVISQDLTKNNAITDFEKQAKLSLKRQNGISKAVNKLTKEDLALNDVVSVNQKVGIVKSLHENKVGITFQDGKGIQFFNPFYVQKVIKEEQDDTLMENVSWERWDKSHKNQKGMSKNNHGAWMVSKHKQGYQYGHKADEDHIFVHGTGKDAAVEGQKWAKKNGLGTVYVLESMVEDKKSESLSFTNIVNGALKVK